MVEKTLSPAEFGKRIGEYSDQTVRRWIEEGKLEAVRAGPRKRWRIPESALQGFKVPERRGARTEDRKA